MDKFTDKSVPYPNLEGITDCHMHLIGPEKLFPFSNGYAQLFPEWPATAYREVMVQLGIDRCIITQTPFYGFDNRNLLNGLAQLGSCARGVAVVDGHQPEHRYRQLKQAGVVGANFYLMPDGELDWSCLARANERIQDYGWHTQLQFNGRELAHRFKDIAALKGTLVFDHIGKFQPSVRTDDPVFRRLCSLLETGRCFVKLSAPYESSSNEPPYWQQAGTLAEFLIQEFPDQLIWGSNWPHLGLKNRSDWPSTSATLNWLTMWGADSDSLKKILVTTPERLFSFTG